MEVADSGSSRKQLALGTVSFAICFCAWGLIGALAPTFREQFSLTATQTSFLVAAPVILGSLARIPVGLLTDRFGGRLTFTLLFVLSAAAALLVPLASSYPLLIGGGFPAWRGRILICGRSGIRLEVVSSEGTGDRSGCLRNGQRGTVRGSVPWPRSGWPGWAGRCFSGRCWPSPGLGGGVLGNGKKRAGFGAGADIQRHDAGLGPGTHGVVAVAVLLSHLWRLCRLLDLPADIAQG